MVLRHSLSGNDWQIKDFYGEDWLWRKSHMPDTRDRRQWRRGSVPGCVQHDLLVNREIPDVYFERNTLMAEWASQRTWIYKKTFKAEGSWRGQRVTLVAHGVDYAARFFLNGVLLGKHAGPFTPAVFDVSSQLAYGAENLLAVVLDHAPDEQPQVGYTSKVTTTKPRMNYWWDFSPRLVHLGIWKDIEIQVGGPVRIEDVFVSPRLDSGAERAELEVQLQLDALAPVDARVELEVSLEGRSLGVTTAQLKAVPGQNRASLRQTLDQPCLWWPNGYGEQPLYQAEARVWLDSGGESVLSDRRQVEFGVRKVEFLPNEGADPSALPYTLAVNGRKVYLRGWNWVPVDVLWGVPRLEKVRHLLELARRAGVTILRVWGGGLIEREEFYAECDRLGIMIWQEFTHSSSGIDNNPPTTPEFLELWRETGRAIIHSRRNHPALAIWCGGNELQAGPEQPLDESHPLLAMLAGLVRVESPGAIWLPTSSSGKVFSNSLENIERDPNSLHDVHGPWEYQGLEKQCTLYNRGSSLLHSEFGVEGITNRRTLDRVIARSHQIPPTLDNPYWYHLGAWWVKEAAWGEVFGEVKDLDQLVRATQWMQADGLRYAVESDRRRAFHNSGTLPWQFNEPFPMAACTSAVDYYGHPKPAYFAVARAYAPLSITARFDRVAWAGYRRFSAEVWALSLLPDWVGGLQAECRLVGADGKESACWKFPVDACPDGSTFAGQVFFDLPELSEDLFFLDLRLLGMDQRIAAKNRYLFSRGANMAAALAYPPTTLVVERSSGGDLDQVTVTNSGQRTALFLWLEDHRAVDAPGWMMANENHFCLFPGESSSILVEWRDVPAAGRSLSIAGWNVDELWLEAG